MTIRPMIKYYISIVIISVIFLTAIVYGFSVIGGPSGARNRRFDLQRVRHLSNIKSEIEFFVEKNDRFSRDLEELKQNSYNKSLTITDPERDEKYEFFAKSRYKYQLCANFSTSVEKKEGKAPSYYDAYTEEFSHPKGHHCFDLEIPEYRRKNTYYPPYSPTLYPTNTPVHTPTPITFVTSCGIYKTVSDCDSAAGRGESCSWYFCRNVCLTTRTDVNLVCNSNVNVVVP